MSNVEISLGDLYNSCFVVMPFGQVFDPEYENVIKPAIKAAGLSPVRADELSSRPQIMADIWKSLRSSRIVIAELTTKNANVFYEVGLAHALGKPVIIITREPEDVPFDLKALRYNYYDITKPSWGEDLKQKLTEMIQKVLNEKEFGTVLDGIKPNITTDYKQMKEEKTKPLPSFRDLTGVWKGQMKIMEKADYELDLKLKQKEFDIEGTMTVHLLFGDFAIIQEMIRGMLMGDVVTLYGVSYTYIRAMKERDYALDSFIGKISDNGNLISGDCDDTLGQKGAFSFERCP
jgi:nucleoside 2-deoxyribosyltransferase